MREYERWVVLVRPVQVTAASMVAACREDAESLGDVTPEAWAEFGSVCWDLEQALGQALAHDGLNYHALMMVDPHVHFHVIPRYAAPRRVIGRKFTDPWWPRPAEITAGEELDDEELAALVAHLRAHWPA